MFLRELAVGFLSPRSLVLLELLAAVVMQQEGSERQPGDVTASAEPPGEGEETGGDRGDGGWCQDAPRGGRGTTHSFIEKVTWKSVYWNNNTIVIKPNI